VVETPATTTQTWTFKPTLLNKSPTETPATITLNFTLAP
jgi:hypothetical protein